MSALTFDHLKAKQRQIRDGFPSDLGLRVHRALSWLGRAEREQADEDASFIFHWIAFNAAYAREIVDLRPSSAREESSEFFDRICSLDRTRAVYDAIWRQFPGPVRMLLTNKYVFQPFWHYHNGVAGHADWEARFERSRKITNEALSERYTSRILSVLFDRLHVLRNQIVHGGATWKGSVNRVQVRNADRLLAALVHIFVDIMMDNPHEAWGKPYYPVVE
jgi:hypothetical protein